MEEELNYVTPTFKSYGAPACGEFYIHGVVTTPQVYSNPTNEDLISAWAAM